VCPLPFSVIAPFVIQSCQSDHVLPNPCLTSHIISCGRYYSWQQPLSLPHASFIPTPGRLLSLHILYRQDALLAGLE
jgi:hypothetical protein